MRYISIPNFCRERAGVCSDPLTAGCLDHAADRVEYLEQLVRAMIEQMEAAFADPEALINSEFAMNAFGTTIIAAQKAIKEPT